MILSGEQSLFVRRLVKKKISIGLNVCLVAISSWSASPLSPLESFRNVQCDVWRTSDGVPYHDVVSLAQSSDGYIWVGTWGPTNNLVRFNGFEFASPFGLANTGGGGFWCLAKGKTGRLWFSQSSPAPSLGIWQQGKVTSVKTTLPTPSDRGIPIFEDQSANLWIGGNGLFVRTPEGQSKDFTPLTKNFGEIRQIVESRDHTIWLATERGLIRYRDGVFDRPYPITNLLYCAYSSKDGSIWVGADSEPGLIHVTPEREIVTYGSARGLNSRNIRAICEDLESNIWVGTYSGLYCVKGDTAYQIQETDLRTAFIFSLLWDREGSLWVGTSDGLYHLHKNPIEYLGASAGLGPVSSLSVGPSGLWANTFSRGVYLRQDGSWTKLAAIGDQFETMVETSKGEIWYSTQYKCYHLIDGKTDVIENIDGKASFCESAKTLWIVNPTNVFSFRDGHLSAMSEGWPKMDVTCVITNRGPGLLIGTTQGLYKWVGQLSKWIVFSNDLPGTRINDIEWDDGTLWLASDQAIARYQDRWQVIRADAGLARIGSINSMLVEGDSLWLGCVNGLFRISRAEIDQYLQGNLHEINLFQYGKAQGVPLGYVGPSAWKQGAIRGNDGKLWFATKNGVLAVDSKRVSTLVHAPVVIESVTLDQQSAMNVFKSSPETIKVPAGTRNMEIQYAALTYIAPGQVVYKYRLTGLDTDWVNAGNSRVARFTRLSPGNYEFQVKACAADGVWNEQCASVLFVQEPFFHETPAFFWLCLFLLIVVVFLLSAFGMVVSHAVVTRRMRRQIALLEAQQALNRERARIARDIHDDVGSTLTQIVLLSELAGREPERTYTPDGYLAEIRNAAREITRRLDEIVWAINPRNDTLDALVSYICKLATDQAQTAGLRCHLDLPSSLPAWPINGAARHNLFLACKEAIHNAIKHAAASQMKFRVVLNPESFLIEVSDNGVGLPNPLPKQAGDGLQNFRERLAMLEGSCDFRSVPEQGTTVSFLVPRPKQENSLSTK